MTTRGPAWEAFVADLGCDYDYDPNSIMAYEAGRADERARGMRRAARYAAEWHDAEGLVRHEDERHAEAQRQWMACHRCDRIARGEPAFTTPRAFRGGEK